MCSFHINIVLTSANKFFVKLRKQNYQNKRTQTRHKTIVRFVSLTSVNLFNSNDSSPAHFNSFFSSLLRLSWSILPEGKTLAAKQITAENKTI